MELKAYETEVWVGVNENVVAYNDTDGNWDATNDIFYPKKYADRHIAHRNAKYCEAMAQACMEMQCETERQADFAVRWEHRWLLLATYYKEMEK